MMNKTTFGAALAFLAAAVGGLTAAALYLHHREKELDEYEKLLFSDDFDEMDEDAPEGLEQQLSDEPAAGEPSAESQDGE